MPVTPKGPTWARPEDQLPRPRVTRDAIVRAAITLADTEGLEAVSIRRVAAALETRPMSLYSHFARKDDLIELMLDRIAGDAVLEATSGDWREALREIARQTRATCLRHPWMVAAIDRRPVLGPNALRHVEQSLAAIAELELEPRRGLTLLRTVDTFTLGHVIWELADRGTQRDDADWQRSVLDYLEGTLETGEFPHLARFGAGELLAARDHERSFETGLDWLLGGIAASL